MSSRDHDDITMNSNKKTNHSTDSSDKRKKRNTRPNKKAKGTTPDAVTCINLYFCVINVYMYPRNRSLVMDLGRPQQRIIWTVERVRTVMWMKLFSANTLMKATMMLPKLHSLIMSFGHYRCTSCYCFSDFDTELTANDIAAILEYINHHYQVAYQRHKQSGSHSDFWNFVGTTYYLFYYHLWLHESPHLLNFAVAELPSHVFLESCHDRRGGATDNDKDDDMDSSKNNNSSSTSTTKKKTRQQKKKTITKKAQKRMTMAQECTQATWRSLDCIPSGAVREYEVGSRVSSSTSRARPVGSISEYKSRLKETRLEFDAPKKSTATSYDSDDSDIVNLKREIALCKKKCDEIVELLSVSDLK